MRKRFFLIAQRITVFLRQEEKDNIPSNHNANPVEVAKSSFYNTYM